MFKRVISFRRFYTTKPAVPQDDPFAKYKPDKLTLAIIGAFIAYEAYNFYDYSRKPRRNILIPDKFTLCDITAITPVSSDTKFYKLRAKNDSPPVPYHVTIKDDSCQVGRSYTPITNDGKEIGLLIKTYPDGVISTMMNKSNVGDLIFVRGPESTMEPYQPNTIKNLGMIAGGTGIAPMYQLIKEIMLNPEDKTQVNLVYCSKTEVLLRKELDQLSSKYPDRLKISYFIDDGKAKVTIDDLKKSLPLTDSVVLVCGNDGFLNYFSGPKDGWEQGELKGLLKELYTPSQVYKL